MFFRLNYRYAWRAGKGGLFEGTETFSPALSSTAMLKKF